MLKRFLNNKKIALILPISYDNEFVIDLKKAELLNSFFGKLFFD